MIIMAFLFIAVLLVGVPVFIALAGSSFVYTHFIAELPDFVILHRMAGGIDSFPLLAVPFFILAGNLMNSAGITNRIYDFAVATCGWMKGGLAHVNIFGSVIFAGMSGTAIADAAGLGTIEIKAMQDHGYDTEFSVGVTAASATLGPIIPPSLPFVIYGMMANVSIGALFMGGFIPGAVMTLFMMGYVYYCARRYGMGAAQPFRLRTRAGSRQGRPSRSSDACTVRPTASTAPSAGRTTSYPNATRTGDSSTPVVRTSSSSSYRAGWRYSQCASITDSIYPSVSIAR